MDQYSNSGNAQKKITPVVSQPGTLATTKKDRVLNAIFSENRGNIEEDILFHVLIPEGKRMVLNAIKNMLDIIFNDGRTTQSPLSANIYSYASTMSNRVINQAAQNFVPVSQVQTSGYKPICVNSVIDARAVLDSLNEQLARYGRVSIGDLYDSVNLTPESTLYNYGWTNLNGSGYIPMPDGRYMINLPKPSPLN